MADDDATGEGLRDRLARQGEDALGKLAQDLLENPIVTGAISRAFGARERAVAAQETRDERAQPAVGRRPGAPDAAAAVGLAAARGHRGRRRPPRPALRGRREVGATPPEDRIAAIEEQLSKLAAEVAHLSGALDAAPAPVPREQERLEVDRPAPARKPAKKRAGGSSRAKKSS